MRYLVTFFVVSLACACSALPQTEVTRQSSKPGVLFADATKKGVYVYPSRDGREGNYSVCVDPSPDAAANLKAALEIAAKAEGKGVAAEGTFSNELQQEIVQLVSRSQGLQLQRDILTQACLARESGHITNQEYVNLFSESMSASTALMVVEILTSTKSHELSENQLKILINYLTASTFRIN